MTSCKECIHKTMCKYTEDFTKVEKNLSEVTAAAVKELPFKTNLTFNFECGFYKAENEPVKEPEKAPVKRRRRTKAEIAEAKAKAIPSNDSADKTAETKTEKKNTEKPAEEKDPVESTEEKVVEVAAEEAPAPTPEEAFSELPEEKPEPAKEKSVLDSEKKQNFLNLPIDELLFISTPENVKKEVTASNVKLIRDLYKPELTKGFSKEAIACLNKSLTTFHLDEI